MGIQRGSVSGFRLSESLEALRQSAQGRPEIRGLRLGEPSSGIFGHSSPVWIEGQVRLWDLMDLVPFGRDPNGAASIVRINIKVRGIVFVRYCYKYNQG
jgi:hypothetical protein